MLVAVVSDTHGHTSNTLRAVRMLEQFEIDAVLHCGDIGSPQVVELFAAWPTHFVFGNVDSQWSELRAAIHEAGQTCHEEFGELEWAGLRVAFLHGHDQRRLRQAAQSGEWDVVCYGHTHVAEDHYEGDTLVLNPGALYRATPHSLALVELPERKVTRLTV